MINNARIAVNDEVQSTARLTLQLIEIAFASTTQQTGVDAQKAVLEQIANMEGTRHLYIELYRSVSAEQKIPMRVELPISANAPEWFIKMVKPPPIEFRRIFTNPEFHYTEILIKADPSDEITEVWAETKSVLVLLLLFAVLANILVYFTLGRGLAPIESILHGLDGIEQGDYQLRLPKFNLPELSRISEKFNHMAEVLQKSRDENQLLTQRTLAIQEDERRHLSQELHDELGQTITAIKAVAVSIDRQQQPTSESVTDSAQTIIKFSNHMYEVARKMMNRLRPAILDELGLVAALQDMIDDWNEHHENIFCHFTFKGEMNHINEEIKINVFRIVQESLTNIVKHSQASDVEIKMSLTGSDSDTIVNGDLILTIHDNGIGFDINSIKPGLGLLGIRERVEALNGSFKIQSDADKGVQIDILIPLKNA